jgi:hypothetical protein
MPQVRFETMNPVFERENTVHVLACSAAVTGAKYRQKCYINLNFIIA